MNSLAYRVVGWVIFFHALCLVFSLKWRQAVLVSLDINKIPVDVIVKVDYTKKRVASNKNIINKSKPKPKKQLKKKVEKNNIVKPKAVKKEVIKKEEPKSKPVAAKKITPKIEKPKEKPIEKQKIEPTKIKPIEEILPEKPENKVEEVVIGREELDELKLSLQMHEQIQTYWKPPMGLKPEKPSKWRVTIDSNGKRSVEKVEGCGILAFDMAAKRTLMTAPINCTVPLMVLEISFTS